MYYRPAMLRATLSKVQLNEGKLNNNNKLQRATTMRNNASIKASLSRSLCHPARGNPRNELPRSN